jgi:hypothetical protein
MMANSTASDPAQQQNLNLREALNDAYAFIEGQKSVQSFAAFTFEEAIQQQNDALTGPDTQNRPNAYNRITKLSMAVQQAVMQIKNMPPEAFVDSDPTTDVNSPATES